MENRENFRKRNNTATIYVGKLSPKTLDSDLFRLFSSIGEVEAINLNKRSDTSLHFAFVAFVNEEDAERAVREFDQSLLHGQHIRVAHYLDEPQKKEDANICVKNIPPHFTRKDLIETFEMFGKIISAKIATYPCGKSKNYGFVQYDKKRSAKLAIKHCSGVNIDGFEIHVELYNQSVRKATEEANPSTPSFTNCYIKNFPLTITEQELKDLLNKFGVVNSLYLPLKEDGKTPKGFAFANFETPEQAQNAIDSLDGKYIFNEQINLNAIRPEPFYIKKAQKKQEREEELRKSIEKMSMEGQNIKKNLYVTNIPKFIEQEELINIFKEFGNIASIAMGTDAINDQKKFAYVSFSTPDEAFIAIEKGNEVFIDGNKLHVAYFKTKAERMREKLSQNIGFNSTIPYIYKSSVRPSPSSSYNYDLSVFSGYEASNNIQEQLYELVLASSNTFKHQWGNLRVSSREEFAEKVTKVLCTRSEDEIKNMINLDAILSQNIANTIEKNEFASGSSSN